MTALRKLLMASLLFVPERAVAQGMLDLLKQDAALSLAFRDPEACIEKERKFSTDTGRTDGARLVQLFEAMLRPLAIQKGLKSKAPYALFYLQPESQDDLLFDNELFVQLIPFTRANALAGNFGIPKGRLMPQTIVPTKSDAFHAKFATRTDTHLGVSASENSLKRFLKSRPLAATLSAPQRQRLNATDILFHVGPSVLAELHKDLQRELISKLRGGDDPAEKKFLDQLGQGLKEAQAIVAGVRLDDGLDAHIVVTVRRDSSAARLLASMRTTGKPSTLFALPDGDVLFAHAYAGDRTQHAWLAQAFFRHFLEDPIVTDRLVASASVTNYLGLLHEIWSRLHGNRFAVYQNAEPAKVGLLSAVIILDCDDPPAFLREMKTLAKMATADTLDWSKKEVKKEVDIARLVRDLGNSSFAIRQAAATRLALIGAPALPFLEKALESKKLDLETMRRAQEVDKGIRDRTAWRRKEMLLEENQPLFDHAKLTFVLGVEKRLGQRIDVIQIRNPAAEPAALRRYEELLGPDWDKIRVAVVGKQIVLMLGSEVARFEAALRNVQQRNPGLAASKQFAAFHERCAKDRLFEFHVGIEARLRLLAANADEAPPGPLTSLSISLGETDVQFDAHMPTAEIRANSR